jgi:putative hydrolase of the HAD superfamily
MIRAVLLDPDGTVADLSLAKVEARDAAIARLVGRESLSLGPDLERAALIECISWEYQRPITTCQIEDQFWAEWFASVLSRLGYQGDPSGPAVRLRDQFVFWKLLEPYSEVLEVLRALRRAGLRVGIVSDSFPSLELSFREMGLDEYVHTYTSGYVVGAFKPSAAIFRVALGSLGVSAAESVFVDDSAPNVEAARHLGMMAFLIERHASEDDLANGIITSLRPLLEVVGTQAGEGGDRERRSHAPGPCDQGADASTRGGRDGHA